MELSALTAVAKSCQQTFQVDHPSYLFEKETNKHKRQRVKLRFTTSLFLRCIHYPLSIFDISPNGLLLKINYPLIIGLMSNFSDEAGWHHLSTNL